MRGKGIRNKSCCIEPIEIAGALTAKHCGDSTSDCSNGVLIYPAKVVKPYGSTGGIGGVKLKVNVKDIASPITARDYKGILRNDGDAIVEVRDAHNVAIIDDQGRANKKLTPSDICPTLRAQSHGNEPKVIDAIYNNREPRVSDTCPTLRSERIGLLVKEGAPLAYDEQNNTLRTDGTVGTLTTDGSSPKHNNRVIVGEGCNDGNAKERNTFEILCLLRKEIGEKAFAEWGIAIVAPFQQAEVLRQGVHEKSFSENREEQSDIQQRPYNSEIDKQVDYKRNCLPKMWDNAEFRCSPCGRGLYQQFREQFDCALQKLSHENPSPQEFMYSLWQASEGIRVLREALSEIQEIRGRIDMQRKKSVRIRRLTPREVWRLQGFPDEYFDKAKYKKEKIYFVGGEDICCAKLRAAIEKPKLFDTETCALCTTKDMLGMEMSTMMENPSKNEHCNE